MPEAASVSARAKIRRASSILKALSPEGRALPKAAPGGFAEGLGGGGYAGEHVFRIAAAPWLCRDPAEREPNLPDLAIFDRQRHRGRNHGEGVGGALPDLEIAGMLRKCGGLAGEPNGDDEITWLKQAVSLWMVARQAMQILQRQFPVCLPCPRSLQPRRERRAARRNLTGWSRYKPRSTRGPRAGGSRRAAHRSPRRGGACCRRSPCRKNRNSASAARGCHRPWRRFGVAARHRKVAPR